jgi:hypothetical protein
MFRHFRLENERSVRHTMKKGTNMILSNQPFEQNVPQTVKTDPTRKTTLNKRIIIAIISLQMSVFVILDLLESISSGTRVPFFYWFYLIGSLFIFVLQFPSRKERYIWKRYEQCRQLAAQGNREQVPLATVQPVPDVSAVLLPIILHAKNRFSTMINIFAMFLVLVISMLIPVGEFILFAARLDLSVSHVSVTLLFLIVFIPLEFLLLFCSINWVRAVRHDSQQLQFTEAGFLRCTRRNVTVVPWKEARLFAIVPMSLDLRKTSSPFTTYELSSANEVLRWSTSKHIARFVGQTTLTPRDRRQQMQTLLSVIATKTNLPLYDLR